MISRNGVTCKTIATRPLVVFYPLASDMLIEGS